MARRPKPRIVESPCLFLSQQRWPVGRGMVGRLLEYYAELAEMPVPVHPHSRRPACGFPLAEIGADAFVMRDYLGHLTVSTTKIYGAANPRRFAALWR